MNNEITAKFIREKCSKTCQEVLEEGMTIQYFDQIRSEEYKDGPPMVHDLVDHEGHKESYLAVGLVLRSNNYFILYISQTDDTKFFKKYFPEHLHEDSISRLLSFIPQIFLGRKNKFRKIKHD